MTLSSDALTDIVERASTISERLEGAFILREPGEDDPAVNARLDAWRQLVAEGDQGKFEKRLAWDGFDVPTVRRALGQARLRSSHELPAWADFLQAAVEAAVDVWHEAVVTGRSVRNAYRFLDPEKPRPFEEVFAPFVDAARRQLAARSGRAYSLLATDAHAELERGLLRVLVLHCAPAIFQVFSAFRAGRRTSLDLWLAELAGDDSSDLYQAFIAQLADSHFLSLFREYPVLGRIMATVSSHWVEANTEFLSHLQSDLAGLTSTFRDDGELGQVVLVQPHLSDRHHNGRAVMAVTFASGVKLVYKPKDLSLEEVYHGFLSWLNGNGAPLPFKTFKVLNRSTHGWAQYVEHILCQNGEEVRRYYQRAGMLTCLVYALVGTDAHCENVIACGEYPVLVDMETLVHPPAPYEQESGADLEIRPISKRQLFDTVHRTGVLPAWEFGPQGQLYDPSPLRNVQGQESVVRTPRFQRINTDTMTLKYEPGLIETEAHLPQHVDLPLSLREYADDVIAGFRRMYCFLVEHRAALLAPEGPVARFAHMRTRFLRHATRLYVYRLFQALEARHLRNGADFSIQLDVLSREMLAASSKPQFWSLLKFEQRALQQLDVPYFLAAVDSGNIEIPGGTVVEACRTEPGWRLLVSRWQAFGESDLEWQVGFMRALLCFRSDAGASSSTPHGNREHTRARESLFDQMDGSIGAGRLNRETNMRLAGEIARGLKQRAIPLADGGVTWLAIEPRYHGERYHLLPMGYSLYEGCSGVALFLAAFAKLTGDDEARQLARAALQPLRKRLDSAPARQMIGNEVGIGGALGCGSLIYALTLNAELLGDPLLLEDARHVAALITPERIAADRSYDVTAGAAGALLGLLALYRASADIHALKQAAACGAHLLRGRVTSEGGPRAWRTGPAPMLTGFAHGAAGIAYALLCLYQATCDDTLRDAAEEAFAYEGLLYDPETGNWPDLRPGMGSDGKPGFMMSWCSGAPGIGLARLGGLPMLDSADVRQDIERAIAATQGFGLGSVDHLCCGSFGRAELLHTAATSLSRPDLREVAAGQVASSVERAQRDGYFSLSGTLPGDIYTPGFFQGMAGIGYTLLRLAYPDVLPSVLLWQ